MRIWILNAAALLMAPNESLLRADTIITKENLSVNGSLKKMIGGEITIVARYKGSEKIFLFRKSEAEILEFNWTTFNSGGPDGGIGLGAAIKTGRRPSPVAVKDIIVLRGGERKECELIEIDDQLVHCNDSQYKCKFVLRVLVGAR